jgi:ubiquinone/menaquinone biosynthesis C-methylase UbiE
MKRDANLIAPAALAAIDRAADQLSSDVNRELKAGMRAMWALGDYHRFARQLMWELGPVLVQACGIRTGQRVLDVAAGTGNVGLRAAMAGAHVVASDLTPENFEAGRHEAQVLGVEVDWIEGDAEALPFADTDFDVVTSAFGAMFAPNHEKVGDELLRVARHGGTIGMLNFRPNGTAADFFNLLAAYLPSPPGGALPPLLWGTEEHVQRIFGDRVTSLEMTRASYTERAASPSDYCELFNQAFGPVIAIRASLGDEPDALANFDRRFLQFAIESNRGAVNGPAEYEYDYLMVVARKR